MKKVFAIIAVAAAISFSASAQGLGSLLGGLAGAAGSNGSTITNILTNIAGTVYSAPVSLNGNYVYNGIAVGVSSSEGGVLSNLAGTAVTSGIEAKIDEKLATIGIKPGTFSITFNADGTCTETLKGKSTKGKWSIEEQKLKLTIVGSKAINITTQLSGSELMLVTDATKLLEMFKSFGANSSNATLKTAATALSGAKGMQAGVTLKKQ